MEISLAAVLPLECGSDSVFPAQVQNYLGQLSVLISPPLLGASISIERIPPLLHMGVDYLWFWFTDL